MSKRFVILAAIAILAYVANYVLMSEPPDFDALQQQAPAPASTTIEPTPAPELLPTANRSSKPNARDEFFILAVNWQPAFCETRPDTAECRTQSENRFDASNFTLHGLWPREEYCGVSTRIEDTDRSGRWSALPEVELSPALKRQLDEAMPGTRSQLERHEWIKHGTCYDGDAETYYAAALDLLGQLNATPVRELFAQNIGKRLTQQQVRAAFDTAFGKGAGERVRLACENDGNRTLISELTIGLWGVIGPAPNLRQLLMAARPSSGGCKSGIVDPVGLQ